jgi:integrase
MEPRYRAMIVVTAYGALRRSEALGLQRRDVDFVGGGLVLRRTVSQSDKGGLKTEAPLKGRQKGVTRRVAIPTDAMGLLRVHIDTYVGKSTNSWLFLDAKGHILKRTPFRRHFDQAKHAIERDDVTFHTLRHSGATWFAQEGATISELMERLGHKNERTAIRYQHASSERMSQLTAQMGKRRVAELPSLNEK